MSSFLEPAPKTTQLPVRMARNAERFKGTYRALPKVEWTTLLTKEFGNPDWAKLYPVNYNKHSYNPVSETEVYSELESKSQLLSPRMACKLFHDGLYIIKKGEDNPKFIQDLIPEVAHKCFKKKQWRKQFYEAMRRVCCRLSIGLGFRPNCIAEDAFIHAILSMSFELGWRRIAEHLQGLPEWEKDRDFSRVLKFGANEEVGNLLNGTEKVNNPNVKQTKVVDVKKRSDVKVGWFQFYDNSNNHLFDHIIQIHDDDFDNWSVTSSSTDSSCRLRSDSLQSNTSMEASSQDEGDFHSPTRSAIPTLSAIKEIPSVLSLAGLDV